MLALDTGDTVVDATIGGTGHARAIARSLGPTGRYIGFDADTDAIARAKLALVGESPTVTLIEANFRDIERELESRGIRHIDKALFDLGWSAFQLAAGRGFSFLAEEPLRMTYAQDQELHAETVVNEWSEESLADVIYGFGEERYARRIARAIVLARARRRITTSRELGEIIKSAVPLSYARARLHPATKTFQAIRIAVNDELGAITHGLSGAWKLINPGGRLAVITFHSIEDRLVKQLFRKWSEGEGTLLTKRPIRVSVSELRTNPHARSAKLRVIQKNSHA